MTKSVFTDQYSQFREMLIESRKSTGLTQAELSAKLAKPQSYVSKYERGERRIDVIEFLQIARALELDVIAFLRKLNIH